MAATKIIDAVVIANNASTSKTLSVNGYEWAVVELVNNQTCDLSIYASVVDAAGRSVTYVNDANLGYIRTGLTATSNGRGYLVPLRQCISTLIVTVTNKSGGADATVSVWIALH